MYWIYNDVFFFVVTIFLVEKMLSSSISREVSGRQLDILFSRYFWEVEIKNYQNKCLVTLVIIYNNCDKSSLWKTYYIF